MFQKLQTYYFLLATACILLMYLFPIVQIKTENGINDFNVNGITFKQGEKTVSRLTYDIQIVIPITTFIILVATFIVKTAKGQKSLGRLSYFFILTLIILCSVGIYEVKGLMLEKEIAIGYRGFYFPVAALAFVFLANRAIKQEEKIEKLLDKLRKNE